LFVRFLICCCVVFSSQFNNIVNWGINWVDICPRIFSLVFRIIRPSFGPV
jgi:hypothetical protein